MPVSTDTSPGLLRAVLRDTGRLAGSRVLPPGRRARCAVAPGEEPVALSRTPRPYRNRAPARGMLASRALGSLGGPRALSVVAGVPRGRPHSVLGMATPRGSAPSRVPVRLSADHALLPTGLH